MSRSRRVTRAPAFAVPPASATGAGAFVGEGYAWDVTFSAPQDVTLGLTPGNLAGSFNFSSVENLLGSLSGVDAFSVAVGGSVNCIKHLQAVATESGCGADVYGLFASLGPVTPVLAGVRPVGEHVIETFEAAGGCRIDQFQRMGAQHGQVVQGQRSHVRNLLPRAPLRYPPHVK